jgi:CRP-like cAMP-binding protein
VIAALRRRLPLEGGEGRTASLLLVHSFAMGAATVFFETAASALFLARFGSAALPYVYVAAAVLTIGVGAAYSRIQARLPFDRLMLGTLWFLVVTVLALRLGLAATGAAWLVFLLLVWYRPISILTDLEFWAVAARLYDVRQAKRLFGVVGSGEVVARIAGSFAVPLLLRMTAVANLMVLSAVALLGCALVASVVLREAAPARAPAPAAHAPATPPADSLGRLFRDTYLRTILGLAFFAVIAKYLVDFAFLEQMRARYADVGRLATFFALFSGVSQTVSLLTRLFVSGPLLSRHGIRAGLLVLPVAHVLCTTAIVAAGFVPGSVAAVFWLVVANQGIYKTLKHPIDNPSFKVLYQPLPKERRLSVQVAVETLLTPLTIGIAGALMVLFSRALHYDPVVFAWVMLAGFACWVWVARTAGAEYVEALVRALRGRVVDDEPFVYGDRRSLEVLERTLVTGEAREVLFALDLMEKAGYRGLERALLRLLDHGAPEVRRSVLLRLARRAPASARAPVAARLAVEKDPRVRGAALRCLCDVGGEAAWPDVVPALRDPHPEVRRGAMIGLLRAEAPRAFEHLVALSSDPQPSERAWAARVVGEVGRQGYHAPLGWLLADGEPEVRRAALQAAGRVRAEELWPLVAENLAAPAFRAAAAQALVSGGEGALPTAAGLLETTSDPSVARQAAWICGRIAGPRAAAALRPHLDAADAAVRLEVLRALDACAWRADGDAEPVRSRLLEEVRDAAWSSSVLRDVGQAPELAVLRLALELDLQRRREAALLLLSFLHDRTAIHRVRDGLAHPSRERRAYALEVLDVTLDGDLKPLVFALLEDLPADARCQRLADAGAEGPKSAAERVADVLRATPRQAAPLTRAAAVHAAVGVDARALLDVVRKARADPSPLVQETARWAVGCLGGTAAIAGGSHMLTIEKVILLKSVPMFAEASEDTLADVASILEEVEVPAGQVVFERGAAGDSMYVVASGRVRVYDGDRVITDLGDREIFGELALLDPEPRFASIRALDDTRLLRLDRESFAELMAGNIEIVRGVLHVLCERLRQQAPGSPAWRDAPGHA